MLAAAPADAINFNFQFQDVDGGTNGLVKGTLSGLVEGNNTGEGITATVISSPFGAGVGVPGTNFYYGFASGSGFTVTGGNITFADAYLLYHPVLGQLWLGTPGNNGFSSIITSGIASFGDSTNSTTQFTPDATPVPFEPNAALGIATLGFCFGAAKLRKNHLAKKRMVSVEA